MSGTDRMLAIDVLRGMTICFMIIVNTPGSWLYVWSPLRHAEWHGCTPTDLVFPAFLFVIGLSMAFSFQKGLNQQTGELMLKVAKRASLIFLVGLLLNWFPFYYKHLFDLRLFGVLQRIALAYLLAGFVIVAFKKHRTLLIGSLALLLIHWFILVYFGGNDPFSLEANVGRRIDLFLFNEAQLYNGFGIRFDPEGLLGTLSSAAQIILGFLISSAWIVGKNVDMQLIRKLVLLSVPLILFGLLLHPVYPINKPLWTGSYVSYTSGILGLTLAVLIWLIDIKKMRGWIYPFRVFGLNPLISFVASIMLVKILLIVFKFEQGNLYSITYKSVFQPIFGNYAGSFLFALTITFLIWVFAFFLYKNQKVIKL